MSRIENSVKNITIGTIGLFASYLLSFIGRRIFVQYLSIEYVGLNGLFYNIFFLLTFAELGFGTAVTFSLYKPLALGNTEEIKILVSFFKKTNFAVGSFILFVGLSLTPFLENFLNETPDIPHLKLIYILYITNSGLGYFLSYKRILLVADQKKYLDSAYHYSFEVLKSVFQIIILVITRNYLFYLLVVIGITIAENTAIALRINSIYPYLKKPVTGKLAKEDVTSIKKNIFALVFHKFGEIIVNGTDNILIVKLVDLATAGIYGGYSLIVVSLKSVIAIFNNAIVASIGNFVVEETEEAQYKAFRTLNFFLSWVIGFCSICLLVLFNPFISLWLGSEYTFPFSTVFVIVLNFYLRGMLGSVQVFYSSKGLFWYDRYKPIFESIINLVASILLAKYYGITGILIGTSLSTLLTCSWFEPYVLYVYGLRKNVGEYYKSYIVSALFVILFGTITWKLTQMLSINNRILHFIVLMIICTVLPNSFYFLVFHRKKEFGEIMNLLRQAIEKRKIKLAP